jgi:hypothetical protein
VFGSFPSGGTEMIAFGTAFAYNLASLLLCFIDQIPA